MNDEDKNIQNDDDLEFNDNDLDNEEMEREENNSESGNDNEEKNNNDDKKENEKNELNELEKCKKERDEYLRGWQRQKADFLNYQKEEEKRMKEIIDFSNENLIYELLVVLDSFDMSINSLNIESLSENEKKILKGIELIRNQFENILKRKGLEKIEALGEKFNPMIHEAIEKENEKEGELIISEVILNGYKLNNKVIRPVKVKVKNIVE